MPDKHNPEEQRAKEYAVLAGQIRTTIQERVSAKSTDTASGTMVSTEWAGNYRFVETVIPGSGSVKFSVWYLTLSPTERMSYYFKNGSVAREGPTSARFAQTENLPSVGLEELKLLAELVGNPVGNAQIAEKLPLFPVN